MKSYSRRQFLRTGTGAVGVSAIGGYVQGCGKETGEAVENLSEVPAVKWRYAICNEIMHEGDGWDWETQCMRAAEMGYEGIELAPYTLCNHVNELSPDQRKELRASAEANGLEILGLHWLLVSPAGLHATTPDDDLRRKTWDYVAELGDFCADLGGKVMIFGSPNQRNLLAISKEQAFANFAEGCARIADQLESRGVRLLIEPLMSAETDVINNLAEATQIVDEVKHPAISTMFDAHHTVDEHLPMEEVVRKYFDYIKHIQIQEMDGTYMGSGTAVTDYVPAMRAFRDLGYDGWVSLEVFDFEPGAEVIATRSIDTLREIEGRL